MSTNPPAVDDGARPTGPPPALASGAVSATVGKGLRPDSVGLFTMISLGLASVAPAYSLTVTLGLVVAIVGVQAPAALLVGFVPILCTSFAYREQNRVMPDCGTNFVWITRSFGPWAGWLAGNWVPQIATAIAMTALGSIGATNLLSLVGLDAWAGQTLPTTLVAVGLIALVTAVSYRGVQLSARVQNAMLVVQLVALLGFAAIALGRGHAATPSLSWLDPLAIHSAKGFTEAVLLCLFIYWGWDAALAVNEEAKDRSRTPGRAAVLSTLILLGTYVFTAVAAISFAGAGTTGAGLADPSNSADVLTALAGPVLGSAAAKLVTFAICISTVSALLTCVVSTARPNVSVSAHGAQPAVFGRIHPRYQTPTFATVFSGASASVLLVVLTFASSRFLGDAILSTSLLIAFYYGTTALSCTWHFRHELRNSVRDLLVKGVLPAAGGIMMLAAFGYSAYQTVAPDYGSTSIDGVGGVFLLGIGSIVLGLAVIAVLRLRYPDFFRHGRSTITDFVVED